MIIQKRHKIILRVIGILVRNIRLLLEVNRKSYIYILNCLKKTELASRLEEQKVPINDPHKDKALGG